MIAAPALARQNRAGGLIESRPDMHLLIFADRAEHPFREVRDGQPALPSGIVAEPQTANLHRIARSVRPHRHEDRQFLADGVAVVLEHGVALSVARPVRIVFADRKGCRRPDRAALFIAQIDRFRLRIAHRIVMPRSQPVHLAVAAPGASQSALGHHGAEVAAGHDVRPRRGRGAAGFQIDRVLPAVLRKSAQPVEVGQLQKRQRPGGHLLRAARWDKLRRRRVLPAADQLLLQRTAIAAQNHAGRAQEQIAAILRNTQPVPQEHAARPVHAGLGGMRFNLAQQLLPQEEDRSWRLPDSE